MADLTYTTAQIYHRLGIPKPTIRNWSAEYAEFLSQRAHPDEGKIRLFTTDDLIVLNTVRHYTRTEGINNNDIIRQILASGQRITELPRRRTPEEERALDQIQLVPLAQLERAMDQTALLQIESQKVMHQATETARQRDRARLALQSANNTIINLSSAARRQGQGILIGLAIMGIGVGLLLIAVVYYALALPS